MGRGGTGGLVPYKGGDKRTTCCSLFHMVRNGSSRVPYARFPHVKVCRVQNRNPALYLNGDLMYSVKSEISQEGEGESAPGLWSESSDVERIPSPICSQRSDGIWSVEARIHKVDPNIAPD